MWCARRYVKNSTRLEVKLVSKLYRLRGGIAMVQYCYQPTIIFDLTFNLTLNLTRSQPA